MTFTQIVQDVMARLNLASAEAEARIGQECNIRYRRVCSSINLITSSRITVQANCTPGVSTLEFPGIEKIVNVQNRTVTPWLTLGERMYEQLEQWRPSFYTLPTFYAIERAGPDSVTILINAVPETALTLYAEGWENKATLSGSNEPDFAEAYHEVLVFGALADEYRKMMKTEWARDAETQYNGMLSDLRMFLAKSSYLNVGQRMFARGPGFLDPFSSAPVSGGGGGGGSTPFNGAQSWTQTGLITFDRAALQPFEVVVGTLKVDNLDADKLDGQHGAFYQSASNLNAGTLPDARFPATLPALNGSLLTALNASALASGTVADGRLSSNVPLKNAANVFSAVQRFVAGAVAAVGVQVNAAGVGLYSSAANVLDFATNGVRALFINAQGQMNSPTQFGVSVWKNGAQSIPDNTSTLLTFDAVDWDTGGFFNSGISASKLTVPTGGDGKYLCIGSTNFGVSAVGFRQLFFRINGATQINGAVMTPLASAGCQFEVAAFISLVAGDYVEIIAVQTSGGALNAGSGSPGFVTRLQLMKVLQA